ncbi:hypothetical protein HAX54_036226 [Datura stramonium]|uniref:Nonsense-mediated mRNA decay factor SMG8 n=1 Tax=Datura stramonium TaxID=4076 RepID=A0ABS8VHY4_DATST|nr:hypothetical protein [Datura stramonium]
MDSSKPNVQSMRVLIRPPIPPSHSQTSSVSHPQVPSLPSHLPPPTSSDAPATGPAPFIPQSGVVVSKMGFDSLLEDYEYGDLQAMLFMFSSATQPCLAMQVCHVVVFIQEGSRFDTQILKKLRVLQAAKQAMTPFVKSHYPPPSGSGSPFASPSRRAASGRSSNNPSPCTPVTLFVFLDDFADDYPSSSVEEPADISSANQSSSVGTSVRCLTQKGSGSVVVLARPMSKSEGGFRKKLQSSLEAQIRFSIKKCRTLSGSETGHTGSRSGGVTSAMLFSLDASKAVALLDITSNKRGESLEFATGLVEDEFIFRQTDILRGRGGVVNANSGPASGVGMVAVAAAAAAASAASGKTFTSPELPHLEKWLSSSQLILQVILSANMPLQMRLNLVRGSCDREILFHHLLKEMLQKSLPVAKETYLNELPPCYPTSQHKAHLERALHAFNSMVCGLLCSYTCRNWKMNAHPSGLLAGNSVMLAEIKPHSSGYVFLHACACGRSRLLRPDPFDFETANVTFNRSIDCDVSSTIQLPQGRLQVGPFSPQLGV